MKQIHRIMRLLLDEYHDITVAEACDRILDVGCGESEVRIAGVGKDIYTIEELRATEYIYNHLIDMYIPIDRLLARHVDVDWMGGPPGWGRTHSGTLVKCLVDFILYDAAVKCQQKCPYPNSNGLTDFMEVLQISPS